MSLGVTTEGTVYAWGKTDGGRLGLGTHNAYVTLPRIVRLPRKAIDVECGYVHSLIVCLNGTVYQCGGVGVDGGNDGLVSGTGEPLQVDDFNIWHRIPEPKEQRVKQERWKKFGQYEVKGRQRMMEEAVESALK